MDETKSKEHSDELMRLREELSQLRSLMAECEQVEETFSERAVRLQAILDTTVDGIITIDEQGIVKSFNRAAERTFGYFADEVIGKNVNMLQPSPYREHHDQYVANYLRTGKAKIIGIGREVTGRRKDGSTFPLYLAVSEARVKGKRFFTGIVRDVTERKQADEALKASEEKYRTLVESSTDAILMVDRGRRIVSSNQAAADLFGFEREELEGRSMRILHPTEDSFISFGEKAFPVVEALGSFRTEWEFVRKRGMIMPIEETLSAIRNPDGSVRAYVAVIRDITERKQAEQELKQYHDHLEELVLARTRELQEAHKALLHAEKLKILGTISAEMAHEIRNPLMSIGGFARRLQKKFQDVPEIEILVEESGRLEAILKRIENYLKPVEMSPRECSVNEIAEEAVGLLSPELNRDGVNLTLDLAPLLSPAYVDPGILIQVLVNVIRNAAKVMNKKGRIIIGTFESDQNIHVWVRAPVEGVKIKDPEHPFMPFGEDRQDISVPVCFRLLRDMGGHLSLKRENDSVVFAASLLKALHSASETGPGSD